MIRRWLPVLTVVLLLWPALAAAAQQYAAKVVGVTDGDTITVRREGHPTERVRVHGIDTPEHGQPYGTRAKQFTSQLVFGQTVTIRVRDRDRYGRTVADVVLSDGRDLGQELVRAGLAWWYRKYSTDRRLEALEAKARQAKRGLWSELNPVPPWEWRRRNRE